MDLNYLLYREQIALMRAGRGIDRIVQTSVARFFGGLIAARTYPHRTFGLAPAGAAA